MLIAPSEAAAWDGRRVGDRGAIICVSWSRPGWRVSGRVRQPWRWRQRRPGWLTSAGWVGRGGGDRRAQWPASSRQQTVLAAVARQPRRIRAAGDDELVRLSCRRGEEMRMGRHVGALPGTSSARLRVCCSDFAWCRAKWLAVRASATPRRHRRRRRGTGGATASGGASAGVASC